MVGRLGGANVAKRINANVAHAMIVGSGSNQGRQATFSCHLLPLDPFNLESTLRNNKPQTVKRPRTPTTEKVLRYVSALYEVDGFRGIPKASTKITSNTQ
jgi:hypothetical protein